MAQHQQEELNRRAYSPYPYLIFGFVLLVATVLLVIKILAHTAAGGTVIAADIPLAAFATATAVYLGIGFVKLSKQRQVRLGPTSKEDELLSAIRKSGGSIIPVEAAVETSLTVREADGMLSELASGGYLQLESRDSALYYSLPAKRTEPGT